MRRSIIYILIVCLMWSSIAQSAIGANEAYTPNNEEAWLHALQSLLNEGLEQQQEIEPAHSANELDVLTVERPVLDPKSALTNQRVITFTGTALPLSDVIIYYLFGGSGSEQYAGQGTASESGGFEVQVQINFDGEYTFYARSIVDEQYSDISNMIDMEVDLTPPSQPEDVYAEVTDQSVEIRWSSPVIYNPQTGRYVPDLSVAHYEIRKANGEVVVIDKDTYLYEENSLPPETAFRYELYAVDEAGNHSTVRPVSVVTRHRYMTIVDQAYSSLYNTVISGDGNVIAYRSTNPDGPGIYVYDRVSEEKEQVWSGFSAILDRGLDISADGRFILYQISESASGGRRYSLHLYDREDGSTFEVLSSRHMFESIGLGGNGTHVVFSSYDDEIVDSTMGKSDVFLVNISDRANIAIRCLSYYPYSVHEEGDSRNPYITKTGAHVVFESDSKALVTYNVPVYDNFSRIHLYEVQRETRYVMQVFDDGQELMAYNPTITEEGNFIAYTAIKGAINSVQERITGYYSRSDNTSTALHKVSSSSDILFGRPYIHYYPHQSPPDTNIYVSQEYSNYNPEASEAPYLSQSGAMVYTAGGMPFQVAKRNLISENGNNARDARLNQDGRAVVFRDGTTNVPGNAVYYVCLRQCADQAPIEYFEWSAPAASKVEGQLKPGSIVSLLATGAPGQQLVASIAYKRWNAEDPDVEEDAVLTLPLSESTVGTYRNSFELPDRTVEITSITARLADGASERSAANLPVKAAGTLEINIDTEQLNMLDRTELVISGSGVASVTIPVQTDNRRYRIDLASGDHYSVVLQKLDGMLLAEQENVQIENGKLSELVLKPFAIYSFYHTASLLYNQYIQQGQLIPLRLVANEGAAVAASVTYTTAEGAGELLVDMAPGTLPSQYEGSFLVPQNATGITSIVASASYGSSISATRDALRGPLLAAGSLEVEIGNEEDIRGYMLTVRSASLGVSRNINLRDYSPSNRIIAIEGVAPAQDYMFTLMDRGGGDWLENLSESVAVEPGQRQTVTLHPIRPSAVIVQVLTEDTGLPIVSGIVISDGTTSYTGTSIGGSVIFSHVKPLLGNRVTITASITGSLYQTSETVIETLLPGITDVSLVIKRKNRATVTGTVTDPRGNPISGATVRVTMNQFNGVALSAEDGTYVIDAPAGGAATVSANLGNQSTPLNSGRVLLHTGENHVPLVLHKSQNASIDVQLFTRYAGGEWVGPHELDWRTAVHYRISANRPILKNASPLTVKAMEGDIVQVCLDGVESGLPKACALTEIDEDMNGAVEIRLSQFEANVIGEMFPFQGVGNKQLYRIDDNGRRAMVARTALEPGSFTQQLPSLGNYELMFYIGSTLVAKRQFAAVEGGTVHLGLLTASPSPMFGGYAGNEVTASGGFVTAGSRLQMRVAYRNGASAAAADARLWLDIPTSAEYVPGSVVWNGEQVAPISEGDRHYIPLGTVSPGASGTVYYSLLFQHSDDASLMLIAPELTHIRSGSTVGEWLGNAEVRRLGVTLTAPALSTKLAIPVSGIAPPGSTVRVYDRSILLGEALAAPNGEWKLTVDKGGSAPIYTYLLSAEAERGDDAWSSNTVSVRVDKHYPEPIEFTMQQTDGRKITIDPRDNGSKFPYVHAPGLPYRLSVTFNTPDRVKNVRFLIDSLEVPASYLPDGTFVANTMISRVGAIGVDYDIVETPASLGTYMESEEDRIAALPPMFRDIEDMEINISPPTDGGNKQAASYRAHVPMSNGKEADYRLNVSLERKIYVPTKGDLDRAEELGIPLYGAEMSHSFRDGRLYIEMNGYIPEGVFDQFAKGESVSPAATGLAAGKIVSAIAARISVNVGAKAGDATWIGITSAFSLYDGRGGLGGILDDMANVLDDVALNCSPEAYKKYAEQVDRLHTKLIINEVIKGGIAVAGAVMGPATFGVGMVALFIVSASYGKLLDAEAEGQLQKLKTKIASDSQCKPQKKPPRKPKKELVDPVWIHDPSGYVFEVEHSNRIEDVKATALNWNTAEERWEIWDAEWFGQQNPLYTNSEGRYGWDVPEGDWKVLYEKEGYLPAESWEMTVLPPHFDVNIGLISILPPEVLKVSAAPGGAYVELVFNRHVLDHYINELTVTVVGSDDRQPVSGELSLVEPVNNSGSQVSRVVRFVPEVPLEPGVQYEVFVDESVQSYNGIAMEEGYRTTVVATATDEQPPIAVSELALSMDAASLIASWKESYDPDLARLEVHVARADRIGAPRIIEVAKGIRWAMAEGLEPGIEYVVEIHALDEAGNASITRANGTTGLNQAPSVSIVPPDAPSDVKTAASPRAITVTWADPVDDDFDHIRIAWRRSGQSDNETVVSVNKGVGTRLIGDLAAGASYDIFVYAVDRNELASDRVHVTATAGQPSGNGGSGDPGGNPGPGAGNEEPQRPDEEPGVVGSDSAELEPAGGVYRLLDGKVKISLPQGALRTAVKLVAEQLAIPAQAGRLKPVSSAYRLKLGDNVVLEKPGIVAIKYDPKWLRGADPRKLAIYRLNDAGRWDYVGGIANTDDSSVSAIFQTSGTYAVMLNEVSFDDMTKHWAKDAVEVLAAKQIVSGVSASRFDPDRSITRAEFAKLVVLLSRRMRETDKSSADSIGNAGIFSDVANDAWYSEYVQEASALGLIQGAYGKFRPNDAITREEMIVIIARALQFDPSSKINAETILASYKDAGHISDWARTSAAYLVQTGLIQGSNGAIHPNASTTRAESAVILLRVLEQQNSF